VKTLIDRRALVATFRELAGIYAPGRGERPIADYVKSRLERHWPVTEDRAGKAIGGNAGNVLVRISGRGEPLLFAAHLDTVEPARGVKPRLKGGYFVSAGDTILGADDRAAVAVLVELAVGAARLPDRRAIEVLFTVGEEVGLLGALHADYRRLRSKVGFVFDASEPPGYAVVSAPGSDLFTAVFRGRAAHAGIAPEKGRSAIRMAAAAIGAMKLGRVDRETTANVGLISGGRAVNIVPDRAEVQGEVRSRNAAKLRAHVAHVNRALKKAAAAHGGRVEISWSHAYDAYHLRDNAAPVKHFRAAARRAALTPRFVAGGGGSDANIFNRRGIPSLVVGCGMEKPHSTEERIAVAALYRLAELATALAVA